MKDDNAVRMRSNRVWLSEASCDLDAFRAIVERTINRADYPLAGDVISNVLVYDGLEARSAAASPESRKDIMAEWVEALTEGPGIIAIRGAFAEMTAIDRTNDHFWAIIEEERSGTSAAAIISPSRARTTASGTRSRSSACATPPRSPAITAMQSSRW